MKDFHFKVDCIITDPPYNISRKNNFQTIGRKGIDFGSWDKEFNQTSWLDGIGEILNDNSSIIIFNDWKNLGDIAKKLEKEGFVVKDVIRWIKTNPMPRNVNRRYVTDYEFAIWATKGKWTFNKQSDVPYLRPEYKGSSPIGTKRIHPTQKSGDIIKQLILTHTNEGDIIFDPFSGSGEISLQAYQANRAFVASEIDINFANLSQERFKNLFNRPAFNHLGNKYRILHDLMKYFPTKNIRNFVDVFAGSGIVSISYPYTKQIYLNEYDKNLYLILEELSHSDIDSLIQDIKNIIKKYNFPIDKNRNYKKEYETLKNDFNNKKIKENEIIVLLVLLLYGFNQQLRFNKNENFNIPAGKFTWNKYQEQKIRNYLALFQAKKAKISNLDFEEFVHHVQKDTTSNSTIYYFDPPYLITNATYNTSWNENNEIRLLNLLQDMLDKKYKWYLSNQLISQNKLNTLLLDFLIKNQNKLNIYKISTNYKNSNYHRKNTENSEDLEILVEVK